MPAAPADTQSTLLQRLLARMRADERGSLVLDILIGMAIFALVAIIAVSAVGQYRMRAYIQAAMSDAEQTANAVAAWITDNASLSEVTYPTGVLTAEDLATLEVTPTSSGPHASEVTVLGNPVDPREYVVCVEYRGAFAEYESGVGLTASGNAEEEGYEGCDATPDDDIDPTDDPTAAPTETPVPTETPTTGNPTGDPTTTPTTGPTGDPTPTPVPTEEPTPTTPPTFEDEYDVASLDYKGDLMANPSRVVDISDDGEWVMFTANNSPVAEGVPGKGGRTYLRNRLTGAITIFDRYASSGAIADGNTYEARMTPNASHIVFSYHGADLVDGSRNYTPQLFVWERATNTMDRIDAPGGSKSLGYPWMYNVVDISDDGRYLAFQTRDPKMLGIPDYTGSNRFVRYDRQTNTTVLIDHAPDGTPGNSSTLNNNGMVIDLTPDGQHATFMSAATNLDPRATAGRVQVYKWTAATNTVELVSRSGDTEATMEQGMGSPVTISEGGRYVAWTGQGVDITGLNSSSDAVVMRDTVGGGITIVSKNANGTAATNSHLLGMTNDGRILYRSASSGVVSNKPATSVSGWHSYLWDPRTEKNRSVDRRDRGAGNIESVVAANGAFVAFEVAEAANYPANAVGNANYDVVVWNAASSERLWPTL